MPVKKLMIIFLVILASCKGKKNDVQLLKFDGVKWSAQTDNKYPYRDRMLKDLIDNYKLAGMHKDSILKMLGQPNRMDNGHYFYSITQTYLIENFPMSTKTFVIKLNNDSTVEWRKIHGN